MLISRVSTGTLLRPRPLHSGSGSDSTNPVPSCLTATDVPGTAQIGRPLRPPGCLNWPPKATFDPGEGCTVSKVDFVLRDFATSNRFAQRSHLVVADYPLLRQGDARPLNWGGLV